MPRRITLRQRPLLMLLAGACLLAPSFAQADACLLYRDANPYANLPYVPGDMGDNSAPIFVDLDDDGDLDLIAGNKAGALRYFRNAGTADAPRYVERTGLRSPFYADLWYGVQIVDTYSAPAVGDIDGDGDLDLVSGSGRSLLDGGGLAYFKNIGTAQTPIFELQLGNFGPAGPFSEIEVGYSSTPALVDLDGDLDLDLVVGNRDGQLLYFKNTGTKLAPVYTEQIGANNPFTAFFTDVFTFPAPTFADLDHDGDLDAYIGYGFDTFRFLRNTGTAQAPAFTEITGANNPFDGLTFDSEMKPAFVDLDGDADLDLVAGIGNGYFDTRINLGTVTAPQFPVTVSYLPGAAPPDFVDLDSDGDLDVVVLGAGAIRYFENIGTSPDPILIEPAINPLNGLTFDVDVGMQPTFIDLDGDLDLDLILTRDTLRYFENTGTRFAASYEEQLGPDNPLPGFDNPLLSHLTFADLDGDTDWDFVIASPDTNAFAYFKNTGTKFAPVFTAQTAPGTNPFVDLQPHFFSLVSSPTLADVDDDGDMDFLVGENAAPLTYFENTGTNLAPVFEDRLGWANPFYELNVNNDTYRMTDFDGDGDLDIVTGPGTLRYYRRVTDCSPPTAVGRNITVQLDGNGRVTVSAADVDGGSSSPELGITSMYLVPSSFTCADLGPNVATLYVSDGINGEVATQVTIIVEGEDCVSDETGFQTADQDGDSKIALSELLRVVQFYNAGGLYCAAAPGDSEDGFLAGTGANHDCAPHDTDYSPQNWIISLTELLRVVQFYNAGAYHYCPADNTEDGFCPGAA